MVDTSSGETWLFPCNAWLGSPSSRPPAAKSAAVMSTGSKCEPSRLLLPAANLDSLFKQLQEEQAQEEREVYKVAFYTSAHSPSPSKQS